MSRLPNETIRQGATLPLSVTVDDSTAQGATIVLKTSTDAATISLQKTASFTGIDERTADLTLSDSETLLPVGEYVYQISISYSDGVVEKYPDTEGCDGECEFPTITICAALDVGVS